MIRIALLGLLALCAAPAFSEEKPKVAKEGEMLPELSATDQSGAAVKLSDFKGKTGLIIFFFPKAFTPG